MSLHPLVWIFLKRLSAEKIYHFLETRDEFPTLTKDIGPTMEEGGDEGEKALRLAEKYLGPSLKKNQSYGDFDDDVYDGEEPEFDPLSSLQDTHTGYDKTSHIRARKAAYFLARYLFTHHDLKRPFSSGGDEGLIADEIKRVIREGKGGILYLPSYNSHFDSVVLNVFLDSLGLGLPFSALGDLMIPNRKIDEELKKLKVVKVTKELLWSPARKEYERVLAAYMRSLLEVGASLVVHAEASRYTTRSIDGTLRATIPEWIIDPLLMAEGKVFVVPLSLSLSRVPEDRSLTHRSPLSGIITLRDRAEDIPITEYLRFGRGYAGRLLSAVFDAMEGVYGRAFVTLGEPFEVKELISSIKKSVNPGDLIARTVLEGVAKNKKILPTHLVARALYGRETLSLEELKDAVEEELEQITLFYRERYKREPNLDSTFSEDMEGAVEEGLRPLLKRKIVSRPFGLKTRYGMGDMRLCRFYANQVDHRVYPSKAEENITVVNAGAFGYTLTVHLGRKFDEDPKYADHGLILYDGRPRLVEEISETRRHPNFFKGHALPKAVHVESDLISAVRRADIVLVATPSHYFRRTVKSLLDANPDPFDLLIATKGFEVETALLPVEVVWEELEKRVRKDDIRLAVISGANLASEIIEGQITATQLAVENEELAFKLKELLETPNFIVHLSRDLVGTQLAAAMKNVYAIAYGISAGSKDVSVNFTSTLVTRISAEIKNLAVAMGADEATFGPEGQAWMADFLATAQGGRNSQFGKSLTKWSAPFALRRFKEDNKNVEGYSAVGAAVKLSEKYDVRLPIVEVLEDILYRGGEVDPRRFLENGKRVAPAGKTHSGSGENEPGEDD